MKKYLFLTALFGLVACKVEENQPTLKYRGNNITEACIDNVVYLIYAGHQQGGITPKINADFYPYTCTNEPQKEKHNGKTTD